MCCCCCCNRRLQLLQRQDQDQYQYQDQYQRQGQYQGQAQDQDQDQNQKTVFKDIGNVKIEIDNENIAVAVLAILGFLAGTLDGNGIQAMLDRFAANRNAGL